MKQHYERDSEVHSIDDFMDVWDLVPMSVITNEFWEQNQDFIKSVTYDLYRLEQQRGHIDLKISAKQLEIIFSNLFKYGVI